MSSGPVLVKLIVPIYTKHLTDTEMIEMIEFYETPSGKSVVSKLPVIAQESMLVGQTWGANLAQSLVAELQSAAGLPGMGATSSSLPGAAAHGATTPGAAAPHTDKK